jgi:two-component system nitrogen regulation sensor histidine kinase NtrY
MLSRTIQLMADEMQDRIGGRTGRNGFFSLTDSARLERLDQIITEISEIHNADINLYDERGDLLVSSQPFVYNEGILSRKMDPQAYYEMRRRRMVQFMQHERYGQLEYVSIYTPFRTRNQAFSAYVNIPYFASTRGLKQEISGFLVALINLNTFVFLMAGVISVIITNRITRSFSWIGRKMQEVNLGKHNEEISWDRKDEIGGLVEQYNRMVRKLEDSATALARTEREGAWREMARQVAHEIKNPLTPMKLSIQYLQKAIRNDATNVRELAMKVAGTLIEQIEHLSKIAAEFSEFANIGNLSNEHFDLHEVLDSLMTLHSLNEKVEISWHRPEGMAMVKADRTQMNRLFTNLLQNAIEAIPDDRQGVIRILEEFEDGVVRISVSDNGVGIPAAMQSRIFTPNFTTKTSGTGLGLAMCKGIVEQARGEIWFETKAGEGTVFHISLPYEKS